LASLSEQLALVNRVDPGTLEAGAGLGLFVIDRVDGAVTVLLVYKVVIHPTPEAGVAALLTESDVAHLTLRRENAVVVFLEMLRLPGCS
jgi:hypothetical protein